MENNIIKKLELKFSQTTYSESDVVYILVEIYKFLEQKGERKEFKFISFYRDWACHYSLDRNANLKEFFKIIIDDIEKNNIKIDRISDNLPSTIKSFSLGRLKEDLDKFAAKFLTGKKLDWEKFKKMLYKVLVDQKLKIPIPRYLVFSYTEIAAETFDKTLDFTDDLEVNLEIENVRIAGSYNDNVIENS